MDARTALEKLGRFLTDYERQEVMELQTVFFLDVLNRKKHGVKTPSGPENHGFDNDQQEYLCEDNSHLAYRFEVVSRIGKGSFGQVYRCFDHKDKEMVACKVLKSKKRLYKQGLVEKKLLEVLKEDDPDDKKNIVRITGSFVFRKHLVLCFEVMSINLYDFIKQNNFSGVSVGLVRRFAI